MGVKVREKVKGSGVWWVFVNHDGERSSTQVGSLRAANRTKEDFEHRLALGLELFPKEKQAPAVATLNAYYQKFERSYLKTACRDATQERYDQCYRLYLNPKFGTLPLDMITRESVKELVAELVEKERAKHTIRNVTACLSSVLNHAIEDKLIVYNPAAKLTKFFKQAHVLHERTEPLTATEVPVFLEATRTRDLKKRKGDPEYCPLFLCAIHTGMRAGELAGLQWGDIDWKGKFLVVRRSVKKGKVYPTKTDKIRRIDMSDDLAEELAAYRRRRLEEAMSAGNNELPAWLFASGEGTPLDMHNVARWEFPNCLAKAGLRTIRFHNLSYVLSFVMFLVLLPAFPSGF